MKAVKFPEHNSVLGANQPGMTPLPAFIIETPAPVPIGSLKVKNFIFRFELTDLDIEQIKLTRGFYFCQTGTGFHPIDAVIGSPFKFIAVEYEKHDNGTYTIYIPTASGKVELLAASLDGVIDMVVEGVPDITADNILFIEKPKLQVGSDGILKLV